MTLKMLQFDNYVTSGQRCYHSCLVIKFKKIKRRKAVSNTEQVVTYPKVLRWLVDTLKCLCCR